MICISKKLKYLKKKQGNKKLEDNLLCYFKCSFKYDKLDFGAQFSFNYAFVIMYLLLYILLCIVIVILLFLIMHLLLFLSPDCLTFWHMINSHINSVLVNFLFIFCFFLSKGQCSKRSTILSVLFLFRHNEQFYKADHIEY